jgi:hypothetical protein
MAERTIKVGAYYYIWWGIPFNNHWNQGVKYTPFLGRYNAGDPSIAKQHILLAKKHGVDFFAVSWLGGGDWLQWDFDDINSNLINGFMKADNLDEFSFCLFYETQIILENALNETINPSRNFTRIFVDDMTYASETFFDHPSYLKIDGKPVVFFYNLPFLYNHLTDAEAHASLDFARRLGIYLIGDVGNDLNLPEKRVFYSLDAVTSYFFAHPQISEGWRKIITYARENYPDWKDRLSVDGINFIPNAYAEYDNTEYCRWKNDGSHPTVLPPNAQMFSEMFGIAFNNAKSNSRIVMITSWNEWLESTSVEPSMEFGETFLHTVKDAKADFPVTTSCQTTSLSAFPFSFLSQSSRFFCVSF